MARCQQIQTLADSLKPSKLKSRETTKPNLNPRNSELNALDALPDDGQHKAKCRWCGRGHNLQECVFSPSNKTSGQSLHPLIVMLQKEPGRPMFADSNVAKRLLKSFRSRANGKFGAKSRSCMPFGLTLESRGGKELTVLTTEGPQYIPPDDGDKQDRTKDVKKTKKSRKDK